MSGFTTCAPVPTAAPDPSRRVNFMHGLVLGPRELTQESAYLANRAEELARELFGYGTVAGLRLSVETLSEGAALIVSEGLALSPRGRPIRVAMPHAVALDEWLMARRPELVPRLRPGFESPPGDLLTLYVVLGYRQCATENEPAPGEPCRGDEPPQVFTRLADDFCLELRTQLPDQYEDDAVREFVAWLRRIEIVEHRFGTATLEELLQSLRSAASLTSPPDTLLLSPPDALRVHIADAGRFFRALWLLWVTELRGLGRTAASGPSPCARGGSEEVLIGEVEVPVTVHQDGRWSVTDARRIVLREDKRPYLVPSRLLQELVLFQRSSAGMGSSVVAAGVLRGNAANTTHRRPVLNGLRVAAVADGQVTVLFDDYVLPAVNGAHQYIVKAISSPRPSSTQVVVNVEGFLAAGIRLRLADVNNVAVPATELSGMEISIEISRIAV